MREREIINYHVALIRVPWQSNIMNNLRKYRLFTNMFRIGYINKHR